jgi:Uncharacterized protein conserved in bacteria
MGVISSDEASYTEQLKKLAPQGLVWPTEDTSNWVKLLSAIAKECARIDAMGALLVEESFPDTTLLMLPNWERIAGLPDDCSDFADTIQVRKQNLLAKIIARGGATKQYLLEVAEKFGFDINIVEFDQFRVDYSSVEDPICGQAWQFAFQVQAPEETISWFRSSGSAAGEPLATWGNERLECLITRLKPAHTVALFSYSNSF